MLSRYKNLSPHVFRIALARLLYSVGAFVAPMLLFILPSKFNLSPAECGSVIGLASCAMLLGNLAGGQLVDRYTWPLSLRYATIFYACSYGLAGLTDNSSIFCLLIIAAYFFAGIFFVCFTASLGEFTSKSDLSHGYSLMYIVFNIGFAIGATISPHLLKINNSLPLFLDAAFSLGGLAIYPTPRTLMRSESTPARSFQSSILPLRPHARTLILTFILFMAHNGILLGLPFYLQTTNAPHEASMQYGSIMGASAVLVLALTAPIVAIYSKAGPRKTLLICSLLYFFTCLSLWTPLRWPVSHMAATALAVVAWVVAEIILMNRLEAYLQEVAPLGLGGTFASAFHTLYQLAAALIPPIIGWTVTSQGVEAILIGLLQLCLLTWCAALLSPMHLGETLKS